jgi:translation initiation factor eIF-2B subunit delta
LWLGLLRALQADIACSYVFLSGLSYSIREVTKVVLGAAAVLSNGTVLSRSGSAAVAMCAAASSKPVLVCCEAFKFHERVQLDSITHNELGDPDLLAHLPPYAPAAAVVSGPAGKTGRQLGRWV